MKTVTGQRKSTGSKVLACKNCERKVENVDNSSASVICWRCVCKEVNPNSIILSDMSAEEAKEFFRKKS